MPTIEWNREMWDEPSNWIDRGDEWTFHARTCSQHYQDWKRSVVSTFIVPYIGARVDVLEVGPGHGRWTEYMVDRVHSLTLVDLSLTCIETCQKRFVDAEREITYIVNDGTDLPVPDASIDVIWSFGTFVHIDESEIESYLGEFRRVLRPGGKFVIHHPGWFPGTPQLAAVAPHLGKPGRVLTRRLSQGVWRGGLDRSAMTKRRFNKLAARNGLAVEKQLNRWGDRGQFGLAVRDMMSIGSRPG